ncbi:hypothetical protein G6F50_017136 [Rhizopus delemar]|uniref:Uncharacterized protein n=1 Tax=Rhizopus delemar TaxID=936053 RepID=A0A9P6XR58_9FUNG|nr:hypothetical protein G6F50_017136 [Rhizopus delemar]
MRLGALVAGYHHQSGGVLVQPVNDTGTRHGRQFGVAVEQAIEQRAAPVARAGMGDEPRGLAHHDPLGAFVHHEEFNGLGREGARIGRRRLREWSGNNPASTLSSRSAFVVEGTVTSCGSPRFSLGFSSAF